MSFWTVFGLIGSGALVYFLLDALDAPRFVVWSAGLIMGAITAVTVMEALG